MRIPFSFEQDFVPEWNGNKDLPEKDQVRAKLKTMRKGDYLACVDAFEAGRITDGEVDAKRLMSEGKATQILQQLDSLLVTYVEIENLEIGDGTQVTMEQVVDYLPFQELCMELLVQLIGISVPSEEDQGNSSGQPASSTS